MGQLMGLCHTLIELEHEREIEESKIVVSRSSHSPIRSLPSEILCRIFRMCIPDNDFRRHTMYAAPLLLGQVCKHWREVAWNEPTLWTRPRLRFYDGANPTGSRLLRSTLDLYRARSKDADFALSINQTLGLDLEGQYWTGDMGEISSILPRCKELWLSCDHHVWLELFNLLKSDDFIHLRSVFLKIHTLLHERPHLDVFSFAPSLRSVRLYLAVPEILPFLSFPYSQLADVSCRMGVSNSIAPAERAIYHWRLFMAKCPNLQTIDAYFTGRGWCDKDRLNTRAVRRLFPTVSYGLARSLVLRVGFQADIATILTDFSFPNLENMELVATSKPVPLICPDIPFSEGLATRLPYVFGLTSLRLIRITISSAEFRALLFSTPLLVSLDVMKGEFNGGLFEIDDEDLIYDLTIDSFARSRPLLPRLRDLRLYLNVMKSFSQAENVERYATLAHSRYNWACRHVDTRDKDSPSSKMSGSSAPSYPFRLHLKYQSGDNETIPAIAQTIGITTFPVLWPEPADVFIKEY